MSWIKPPIPVNKGGTGSTTASGARTNLAVPLNTNTMLLDGTQVMAANMDLNSHKIVNLTDPSNAQDAATKAYVDAVATGLDVKASCRVATTGSSITLSGSAPNTLDSITLAANDRILVKDQSTASQNGIYYVSTLGTGANGTWTRATDADASAEVTAGLFTFIEEGTTNADTGWILTTDNPITVGSTSLAFTQFTGAGAVVAGNGLTKTGNSIDVVGTTNRISVAADSIDISTSYVGQATITTLGTIITGTWTGTSIAVANGGTGAGSASSARSNLATAPNTPSFWVGASNSEIANALVPSNGTGISITPSTAVIAVDTAVVWTTSNTISATGKTLTSPVINTPQLARTILAKTANYTVVSTDDIVTFTISSGSTATLPASAGVTTGHVYTIKNKSGSSANLTIATSGSDTGENSGITSGGGFIMAPGDLLDITWDGSEWVII